MKQSKRLLCVLIAMIMLGSTLVVGANAYKTSYQYPDGYDSVQEPYFNSEQAASALLDYIDDNVMSGINASFSVLDISVNIYSLDSTFDSVKNLVESTAYTVANILSLGDIEDLNLSIPKNSSIRRRSTTLSDMEFLSYFLQFLQQNSSPLYKLADNSFSFGALNSFLDLSDYLPMLDDLHGYINEQVYKAIIDPEGTGFDAATSNLDDIIQEFINNRCVKFICDLLAKEDGSNVVADFLGLAKNEDGTLANQMGLLDLCPSLTAADIDIKAVSTYTLIKNLVRALIDDVVTPYAGGLILDALKIDPEDPAADTSYVDIAIGLFVDNASLGLPEDTDQTTMITEFLRQKGVANPENPKPIDKTNAALSFILSEGITKYIYFKDDGNGGKYLTLDEGFASQLSDYVKILIPMLSSLVKTADPLTPEQEAALENMNQEQTFAFAVQYLLDTFVEGVRFPKNCDTIKELVSYTLVNVAAELVPEIDFEAKIESGEINPDSDQCLDIAAAVIRYYIVGETGIVIENKTPTFVELLNDCVDYYLGKYLKLFNVYPTDSSYQTYKDNVWYKLFMSVNQWIPLTTIVYGVEDNWQGMQEIVMDKLINSILDFDIQSLFSIVGVRTDSDLQKPLTQVVANLLARVINGVFLLDNEKTSNKTNNAEQLDLIIPYAYTTLDEITTNVISSSTATNGCGLKNTVKQLLFYITNVTGENSLFSTSLDLVAELMKAIDLDNFEYMKVYYGQNCPAGTTYSISQLKSLYTTSANEANASLKYYEDGYKYFAMVDYAPWSYLDFNAALKSAKEIIDQYDNAKVDPETYTFPTRADITYAYYALNEYNNILVANQTEACDYQLNKVYTAAIDAGYTNTKPDNTQAYTDRTWAAYQHAIDFAKKVLDEYAVAEENGTLSDYRQSKINEARRQLIDAVDKLKGYIGLADYTNLDATIDRVFTLTNPGNYTNESVNTLIDAYKKAHTLDRDYDSDDQDIVDDADTTLASAIDSLLPVPSIEFYDIESQHIDTEFNYVYGFEEGFYNASEAEMWGDDFPTYFMVTFGITTEGDIAFKSTNNGNGTGSKLQILTYDSDGNPSVARDYTMILFGDLNGDSYVDAQDAVIMRAYSSFMLDEELAGAYVNYAGDINFDGNIGSSDAKQVENAGLKKVTINQRPECYTNKEITFMDLINK